MGTQLDSHFAYLFQSPLSEIEQAKLGCKTLKVMLRRLKPVQICPRQYLDYIQSNLPETKDTSLEATIDCSTVISECNKSEIKEKRKASFKETCKDASTHKDKIAKVTSQNDDEDNSFKSQPETTTPNKESDLSIIQDVLWSVTPSNSDHGLRFVISKTVDTSGNVPQYVIKSPTTPGSKTLPDSPAGTIVNSPPCTTVKSPPGAFVKLNDGAGKDKFSSVPFVQIAPITPERPTSSERSDQRQINTFSPKVNIVQDRNFMPLPGSSNEPSSARENCDQMSDTSLPNENSGTTQIQPRVTNMSRVVRMLKTAKKADIKARFTALRNVIPDLEGKEDISDLQILLKANEHISDLKSVYSELQLELTYVQRINGRLKAQLRKLQKQ